MRRFLGIKKKGDSNGGIQKMKTKKPGDLAGF
jgi:hypothetical protein